MSGLEISTATQARQGSGEVVGGRGAGMVDMMPLEPRSSRSLSLPGGQAARIIPRGMLASGGPRMTPTKLHHVVEGPSVTEAAEGATGGRLSTCIGRVLSACCDCC